MRAAENCRSPWGNGTSRYESKSPSTAAENGRGGGRGAPPGVRELAPAVVRRGLPRRQPRSHLSPRRRNDEASFAYKGRRRAAALHGFGRGSFACGGIPPCARLKPAALKRQRYIRKEPGLTPEKLASCVPISIREIWRGESGAGPLAGSSAPDFLHGEKHRCRRGPRAAPFRPLASGRPGDGAACRACDSAGGCDART